MKPGEAGVIARQVAPCKRVRHGDRSGRAQCAGRCYAQATRRESRCAGYTGVVSLHEANRHRDEIEGGQVHSVAADGARSVAARRTGEQMKSRRYTRSPLLSISRRVVFLTTLAIS